MRPLPGQVAARRDEVAVLDPPRIGPALPLAPGLHPRLDRGDPVSTWERLETAVIAVVVLATATIVTMHVEAVAGQFWSFWTAMGCVTAGTPLIVWSLYRTWLR